MTTKSSKSQNGGGTQTLFRLESADKIWMRQHIGVE